MNCNDDIPPTIIKRIKYRPIGVPFGIDNMPVSVAEYFGQRTDVKSPIINPINLKEPQICPFMNHRCIKINNGNHPICSVRRTDGTLWIVCSHRLCSTKKDIPLTNHQKEVLSSVAKTVYDPSVLDSDILLKREEKMPVSKRKSYHADFIMVKRENGGLNNIKIVLEMQGGGETSNTGILTNHVNSWVENINRTNEELAKPIQNVGTLETNAWRRQQEQFIVKGNIASQTGGRIVFCMGSMLFDYLTDKAEGQSIKDLRDYNWTLALISFIEDKSKMPVNGPIPLIIDEKRLIFTNYLSFVQYLINQGEPAPEIFKGEFLSLDGQKSVIN